ncbi:ATPase synthesis protein 25 mitochondrial [Sporothrix stenoceras]|uniref:ATPase synthesis protein 25 n=1 Tax=Sporothrix stenoceras TaxID=5173 RepID=A0ABR3ZRR1_9PEZI
MEDEMLIPEEEAETKTEKADKASIESTTTSSTTPSSSSDLPWYLKIDIPKHDTLTPHDVPLPDIPPESPTLLTPMVSFIADDLGLDDLNLLDLRALDPPAGLGPDLLMLFGSARSERHLHVSADRLVRWLRSHGIHANADGLLGRNELKIKLRRKARRAKLLGTTNMGQLEAASNSGANVVDDGISTQWVCLHAGTLGRSVGEGASTDAEGRTSGFGSVRSAGTTVVVQMLTEAKRKQLDLETLWSKNLVRSVQARKDAGEELSEWTLAAAEAAKERLTGKQDELEVEEEAGFNDAFAVETSSSNSPKSPSYNPFASGTQKRSFSTSARRSAALENAQSSTTTPPDMDIVSSLTQTWLGEDDIAKLSTRLAQDSAGKAQLQKQLIRYLDTLPPLELLDALDSITIRSRTIGSVERAPGSKSDSTQSISSSMKSATAASSTKFIAASVACMRDVPPAQTWALRAHVHARALMHRHDKYDVAGLADLISEMQEGGLPVTRELCTMLLQALFVQHPSESGRQLGMSAEEQAEHELEALSQKREVALSLLTTMYERGQETIARDVIVAMIAPLARFNGVVKARNEANAVFAERRNKNKAVTEATLAPELDENGVPRFEAVNDVLLNVAVEDMDVDAQLESDKQDNIEVSPAVRAADALQTTLEALLHQADLPCLSDGQMISLFRAYAAAEDWTRFWNVWRMPPQHGLPRSAALYAYVYRRMAKTGHMALCRDAVRRCFHEMLHEQVPVLPKGSVYNALKDCIRVADPYAETKAKNLPDLQAGMSKEQLRVSRSEFVQILQTVESLR